MTEDSAVLPQPATILAAVDKHAALAGARRFVVAYSGGLDSTVLLDLARRALPGRSNASLVAIHVDHNLQPASQAWSHHCATTARQYGVEFLSCDVQVDTGDGQSPEAAAREARYAALARHIGPGDVLLTAHHCDDQMETVLLQLFRGAGVAGLAGMPELAGFAAGWCLRPLLAIRRSALLAYARAFRLDWLEDPSNDDRRYDRNFLRQEVLPRITERYPAAAIAVTRSARHCAAATHVLREVANNDLATIAPTGSSVDLQMLSTLSIDRQDNALRQWLRQQQLPLPGTAHLSQIRRLLQAAGAAGCVSWSGAEVRRYRNRLYAMLPLAKLPSNFATQLSTASTIDLPANLGALRCMPTAGGGLDPDRCGSFFTVRFRAGGEKLRPGGSLHRRALSDLFQEVGVVPWMRDRIPLIYAGDRLAAVADLWREQELSVDQGGEGLGLGWQGHPSLY